MKDEQNLVCLACGEPVKGHWRFCPACETSLLDSRCPQCRQTVKENWKRCPECGTVLVCGQCGRRLDNPMQKCSHCQTSASKPDAMASEFHDSICGIEMVFVPGGRFDMGDTFGGGVENEGPVHVVTLSGFYMARYPVTQSQWGKLIGDNPSRWQGECLPVEQITYDQAEQFTRMLTEAHQDRYGFMLPSEAQWEYAARSGGRDELYAGGDDIKALAWYEENSGGRSHPVGTKGPNGLGLYDMSGNVWEWCRDSFVEDSYARQAGIDPVIEDVGPDKVIRGGSWHLDAWSARCTRRIGFAADMMGPALGFRVVMVPMGSGS